VTRVLRLAWDRAAIYLPVLLMGALALGSYWLVRSTPGSTPAEQPRAAVHDPDYFMRNFSVKTFDATGRLKSEVVGTEARHYPDTDTLEIDNAHIRSFDVRGRVTVSTANRALSNADGSEVQLFGNAVVTRTSPPDALGRESPKLQFRGEFLHAFLNEDRVRSNQPVTITRGDDKFTADAMEFDNLDQVMRLHGRVKGTIAPAPAAR
jgi:lipopolysaccharide export system protein LptC